jgi:hypothetical protein
MPYIQKYHHDGTSIANSGQTCISSINDGASISSMDVAPLSSIRMVRVLVTLPYGLQPTKVSPSKIKNKKMNATT